MVKKSQYIVILTMFLAAFITRTAFAANAVSDINDEVMLREDGSAYDKETVGDVLDITGEEVFDQSEKDQQAAGPFAVLLGVLFSAIPMIVIISLIWRHIDKASKTGVLYKNADYFKNTPIAGNLEATFELARQFKQADDDKNLVGAAFLKLISTGCLEPVTEKTMGQLGIEKESVSLKLIHPPDFAGEMSGMLYDQLVLVCGKGQILQEQEMEKYCISNYSDMMRVIDAAKQDGKRTLQQIGCYDDLKKAKQMGLTDRGRKLLTNIMGFKKYLLEFSQIGERSMEERVIWQDYLIFAMLLGIGDTVIEQFERLFPYKTQYSENAQYYYMLSHRYTRASYQAALTACTRKVEPSCGSGKRKRGF